MDGNGSELDRRLDPGLDPRLDRWVERWFELSARGTSVRTECVAGITTFLALSYILFVQPAVMAAAGIPPATALVATCVGSAIACVAMAFLANYPIALAPAMGHNFYFAFTVCGPVAAGGLGLSWQQALAAVVCAGTLFIALSLVRFRERILEAFPDGVKHGIAAGIGLLILVLGLGWGGIVVVAPKTMPRLGDLGHPVAWLALGGLVLTILLVARRVRAALLWSVLATLGGAIACGIVALPRKFVSLDVPYRAVVGELDFAGLFRAPNFVEVVAVFLVLAVFDTIGTLVAVGARAGLLVDGKLPRAGKALLADSIGTVAGGLLGTSTITSYIESAAGVSAGGRTGLANLFTAACLLLALPFAPWIELVGGGVKVGDATCHPVLAPVLIVVGAMMALGASQIRFRDGDRGVPAVLAMLTIPITFSITDGIAIGFVASSVLALFGSHSKSRRRPQPVSWLTHLIAAGFVVAYLMRGGLA